MLNRVNGMFQIPGLSGLLIAVVLCAGLVACQMPEAMPAATPATESGEMAEAESPTKAEDAPSAEATEEPSVPEESGSETEEAAPAELLDFTIVSGNSEVRFIIDETLAGVHTEVVGVTSVVTGSLRTSPAHVRVSEFAPFVIDATTFVTDSNRRNRAIRNFVLYTNLYPEITFVPSSIGNAPDSVSVGEEFSLEVTGPLQVLDTNVDVTFVVTAVFNSETELTGTGSATIILEDHGINVPMPPLVSWVDDKMMLEMDFHAVAE